MALKSEMEPKSKRKIVTVVSELDPLFQERINVHNIGVTVIFA